MCMFMPDINYKKAGVMLCDLADHATEQQVLFMAGDTEGRRRLMAALPEFVRTVRCCRPAIRCRVNGPDGQCPEPKGQE